MFYVQYMYEKKLVKYFLFYVGGFDVYNVETALPKIEWDAVEANLRAASDEEKRVRAEHYYLLYLL